MNIRQTLLIRTDLKFPTGLLAAQVAHLSFEQTRQMIIKDLKEDPLVSSTKLSGAQSAYLDWVQVPYIFVHEVPNAEVLNFFKNKAESKGIAVFPWYDTVFIDISPTQREVFENVLVGISFDTCDSDKIKAVIGDLPLLH